jgi:hypothetical protein
VPLRLVGSEMCIRDRQKNAKKAPAKNLKEKRLEKQAKSDSKKRSE